MAVHHHHDHRSASLTRDAQRTLEEAGEQWTAMRASIFDALSQVEKPVSAYDIAENVSAARGKRVAPNSVYRILDLFVKTNLARRIESANAYVANSHPACQHDCIFLICDACGATTHIDDDALARSVREAAEKSGFAEVRPVIEARGLCEACR